MQGLLQRILVVVTDIFTQVELGVNSLALIYDSLRVISIFLALIFGLFLWSVFWFSFKAK